MLEAARTQAILTRLPVTSNVTMIATIDSARLIVATSVGYTYRCKPMNVAVNVEKGRLNAVEQPIAIKPMRTSPHRDTGIP